MLGYGISKRETIRFHERRILRLETQVMENMVRHIDKDSDGDGAEDSEYISSLERKKKRIITISGDIGSGVSTITQKLSESLEYRRFSAGGLFRNVARQHNMTVEELNEYAKHNKIIDQQIDTLIRQLGEGNEIVLDARLGYYWIHDSFRVYLQVGPDIAAQRIYADINEDQRNEEGATTTKQIIISIHNQANSTQERYFHDYGIDIGNTKIFDLLIDTNNKTPEEVVNLIKKDFTTWLRGE